MNEITATDLARNLKRILDQVEFSRVEISVTRNQHQVARILPGMTHMTALEALGDLYRTLPEDAAKTWIAESRENKTRDKIDDLRDPWDS